jgi:large subunit ribosomal protein L30
LTFELCNCELLNLKSTMAKITITLVKSTIHRPKDQKDTVRALGIRKMNGSVEKEATPQILGMVKKIAHLVTTVTEG